MLCGLLAIIAGCGGGSTGDTDPEAPESIPIKLDSSSTTDIVRVALLYSESLLALARDLDSWASVPLKVSGSAIASKCANGGQSVAVWTDVDRNGVINSGDRITLTLTDCFAPTAATSFTGNVELLLRSASDTAGRAAQVRFGPDGLRFTGARVGFAWKGALDLQRSRNRLGVLSALGSELTLTSTSSSAGLTRTLNDTLTAVDLLREVVPERAGTRSSLRMVLASGVLRGKIELQTPQALFAYFNTFPSEGRLKILGAAGASIDVAPGDGSTFAYLKLVDSPYSSTLLWSEFLQGFLWWHDGELPAAYSDIQTLKNQVFTVVGGTSLAVAPAQRELSIQFTRELVNGATLLPRLIRKTSAAADYDWSDSTVEATFVGTGAARTIRWTTQLQPGRRYALTWIDASNRQAALPESIRGEFLKPEEVTLDVAPAVTAVIAKPANRVVIPGRMVTLDAGSSGAVDGPISYRWKQIEGPEVIVSGQNSSRLAVDVASQAGRMPFDAAFALEVASADGVIDRERMVLRIVPSPADASIIQVRSPAGDPLFSGTGLLRGDSLSEVGPPSWRFGSPTRFIWFSLRDGPLFLFSLPLGVALAPGTFVAPVNLFRRSTTAAIDIWNPDPICTAVDASFTIIEVALSDITNIDGTLIDKLAVDIVLSCNGGPPSSVALRYRSTVELPPGS